MQSPILSPKSACISEDYHSFSILHPYKQTSTLKFMKENEYSKIDPRTKSKRSGFIIFNKNIQRR